MPTRNIISARTDAEWPADHGMRKLVTVGDNAALRKAHFLVCSLKGEPRIAPPPDDRDVEAGCNQCGNRIVHRASAPPEPERLCWKCYALIT